MSYKLFYVKTLGPTPGEGGRKKREGGREGGREREEGREKIPVFSAHGFKESPPPPKKKKNTKKKQKKTKKTM